MGEILLSEKRQEALELESLRQPQLRYLITGICRIQHAQPVLEVWAKSLSFTDKQWNRDTKVLVV